MRNLRNSKGFTLIELMIVVVIIGILAAIAIPKFSNVAKSAKEAEADPILKQAYSLQESYYQRYDVYADGTQLQTMGWDPAQAAKYYTFTVANSTNTFCVNATAVSTAVTKNKKIDQTRAITDGQC